MKYALLIFDRPETYRDLPEDERAALTAEYMAIVGEDSTVGSAHLQPIETATTVRVEDGKTLTTDGPFADTKEVFAGFYMVEAEDLDGALAVAARIPAARLGGAIEIRPIVER